MCMRTNEPIKNRYFVEEDKIPVKRFAPITRLLKSEGPRLRSRPKFSFDQTFQTEIISDQTFQTQKVSEQTFQTEGDLIRPSSDHGLDSNSSSYDQTPVRSKRLWSDSNALKVFMIRSSCA